MGEPAIDWEGTLAYRRHLWGLGFKIAEAMDTAQRGMGLSWPFAQELIRHSLAESRHYVGADLAIGAGTDQLDPAQTYGLDAIIGAYSEQFAFIEKHGGRVIMMASRALAQTVRPAKDYLTVYRSLLAQAQDKVILHWLGPMFDPKLAGYWGSDDFPQALDCVLELINSHAVKIDGIKISLLDDDKEIALRRSLPHGVRCYTGDDFHYASLVKGDEQGYSHALLGIFDAIAPQASQALAALATGDEKRFQALIEPTVPLARKIFEAPTQYYKAGIVLLAWLNGHQSHFTLIGGLQSSRSIVHYADIFRLADKAGCLSDPDLAAHRLTSFLKLYGVIT